MVHPEPLSPHLAGALDKGLQKPLVRWLPTRARDRRRDGLRSGTGDASAAGRATRSSSCAPTPIGARQASTPPPPPWPTVFGSSTCRGAARPPVGTDGIVRSRALATSSASCYYRPGNDSSRPRSPVSSASSRRRVSPGGRIRGPRSCYSATASPTSIRRPTSTGVAPPASPNSSAISWSARSTAWRSTPVAPPAPASAWPKG